MQALGAVAVIVGDNEYRNSLVPMGPEYVEGVEIPSSFVSLCMSVLHRVWDMGSRRPLTISGYARHLAWARAVAYEDMMEFVDYYQRTNESGAIEYTGRVKMVPDQFYAWPMLDIVIACIVAPLVIVIFMYSLWRLRNRHFARAEAVRRVLGEYGRNG